MNSRERMLAAMNHCEPDRVPIVLGVSNAAGIKMNAYRALKKTLGINAPDNYLYHGPELGTAWIDEQTQIRLGSDVRGVLDREPESIRRLNQSRDPHAVCIDSWGSGQREVAPGEWFPGVHPLAEATSTTDVDSYPWPDGNDASRVSHARRIGSICKGIMGTFLNEAGNFVDIIKIRNDLSLSWSMP